MTDISPPNLSVLTVKRMHAVFERTHLLILNVGYLVLLLPLRFWPLRKQAVGQGGVVLMKDRHKPPNDRTGATNFPYASILFCVVELKPGILSESKAIQAESDLILRTGQATGLDYGQPHSNQNKKRPLARWAGGRHCLAAHVSRPAGNAVVSLSDKVYLGLDGSMS